MVCTSQTPKLGAGAGQLNDINKIKKCEVHTLKITAPKEFIQAIQAQATFRPSGLHQAQC